MKNKNMNGKLAVNKSFLKLCGAIVLYIIVAMYLIVLLTTLFGIGSGVAAGILLLIGLYIYFTISFNKPTTSEFNYTPMTYKQHMKYWCSDLTNRDLLEKFEADVVARYELQRQGKESYDIF